MSAAFDIPVLRTERVTLRAPVMEDFPAFAGFYASARGDCVGGRLGIKEAFRRFASLRGHWDLRGFGWWIVEHEGAPAGFTGIHLLPPAPRPELGWALFEGFEGRGFALEAARAALDHARRVLRPAGLVSCIVPGNARSETLARRLGATPEEGPADHDPSVVAWVHDLSGGA